jgi:hypothetical protein
VIGRTGGKLSLPGDRRMLAPTPPAESAMDPLLHEGGCHCGSLRWQFTTTMALANVVPRACDCDYCTRHRAAWVSDAAGQLRVQASAAKLQRYRQGSGQAEFLLCRDCGVLVAVIAHSDDGRLLGAVNRNAFDQRDAFMAVTVVSPQRLAADTRLARWSQLWTPAELDSGA